MAKVTILCYTDAPCAGVTGSPRRSVTSVTISVSMKILPGCQALSDRERSEGRAGAQRHRDSCVGGLLPFWQDETLVDVRTCVRTDCWSGERVPDQETLCQPSGTDHHVGQAQRLGKQDGFTKRSCRAPAPRSSADECNVNTFIVAVQAQAGGKIR